MIYDISQPVFGCEVYPGDPGPEIEQICAMEKGDSYNLTAFSMCAHNGTHVDAPAHFIKDGKGIGEVSLDRFIGYAYVASHEGELTAEDAVEILLKAAAFENGAGRKILIKGNAVVSLEAAREFAQAGIDLIGCESQSVGPEDAPMAVHMVLLKADVVLLEGIRPGDIPEGVYLLNCAPLNLGSADGAPCRAVLMDI